MDGIWTLVVCLGVMCSSLPGLAQDSSRTLYLISVPEVLYAGTPTPLAVTVFANFPGRVTAELSHGDTKVSQTEDFQGGLTRILTLPAFPRPEKQDSLLNLTVRGYQGDSLLFANSTLHSFSPSNISTFVQTDKPNYQLGDTVKVRIASVQLNNHPYKGSVDMSIQDPRGNIVDTRESSGNLGIVLHEFSLPQTSPLGQWAITTTVNGVTEERAFVVEQEERIHFEVLLKTPPHVLVGNDMTGSVRALHPSGKPVQGTLAVTLTLASDVDNDQSPLVQTQTKEIYGSTQFLFGKNLLLAHPDIPGTSDIIVHITASVADNYTGITVNKTVEVHLMRTPFRLEFHDVPPTLKPSLNFSTTLKISTYDRKPLSSMDLTYSAVIKVTQSTSMTDAGPTTTLTLPVPEDGNINIKFELQDQVVMLFIRARFQSSTETLRVYNNYSSPNGSYIQITPISALPAQIGLPLQLGVESTFQPTALHFVVSSRGQVVAAGTKTSSSFSLSPDLSWSPEAFVTVYCILPGGEVASDTTHIPINQHNYVSVNWSRDKAQPGEEVSLSVTAAVASFQVGIAVMGTRQDTPSADLDLKQEQVCNIRMLTNGRLFQKKQPDGPTNEGATLMVKEYWSHWMAGTASLLWLDTYVSDKTWTSEKITVPDGFTSLKAVALVMSDSLGLGFTHVPQKLTVSKDFSLSLDVPSSLTRGEEIVLEAKIINHLEQDIEVIVLLAQNEAFEFVQADRGDVLVMNAQKLDMGSHVSASALFPIRPVALGEMEITVDAVSAEASDSHVWKVLVKPEGVEQSISKTLFLELAPVNPQSSRNVSYSFPPDVVPGSQRVHVAAFGDFLALSMWDLGSLVDMPLGGGEQNMILFAPSLFVLQYLHESNQDNKEVRNRALGFMLEAYQRQLTYLQDNGSFSPFGASDASGSTWLTAYVARSFHQAQDYMQIDKSVLDRSMTWLLKSQGPQGEFSEAGRLIHTEMQEELDDGGPVALTAYVLITLLQDESFKVMHASNVTLAKRYLEDKVSSGGVSNYSLCLVAYALAMDNSAVADTALHELSIRADYIDGVMMWTSSAGLESHDWRVRAAQIEMASYVLLAHFLRGSIVQGFTLLKWLSQQASHLGGYRTTQDTAVAIQALAKYASLSGASSIDLTLNLSAPASSFGSLIRINSTTYQRYHSWEVNADERLDLDIYMEGKGFAIFQMNVFYNLESRAFSQNPQHATDTEGFSLHVDVAEERDQGHMLLTICTRLKNDQVISRTGMAIVDVGMLSGFSLSPEANVPTELIRKMETQPEKIILYLDSLTKSEVCVRLPIVRVYKVACVHDAVVNVYDYYEPTRRATKTYNSDVLRNLNSCFYCGESCNRCRPGITLTVTSASSPSISRATYGLFGLLLVLTAFFIEV